MHSPFSRRAPDPFTEPQRNSGMFGKVLLGLFGMVVLAGIVVLLWVMGVSNGEVDLRNRVMAQQQVCKASFDTMWKILAQKAQIAERYRDSFREIYPQLIAGRYGNDKGGVLLKWVQESNPQFDVSLYKDLMAAIEGERKSFFVNQKQLIDLKRQHDTTLQSWPNTMVLAGRQPVEITVVTSATTDDAYRAGQENDVALPGANGSGR